MNKLTTGLTAVFLLLGSILAYAGEGREEIHASAEQVQPLMPGMTAPNFTLRNPNGESIEFNSADLDKPVVLSFFRGGWCPYCNLHLSEMRKAEAELKEMGFDIWFISIDKPELLLESLDDPEIGYTVYSDSSLQATRAFGLAFQVEAELVEKYKQWDIDLEKASGETHHVLPAPATFIIGQDGIINFGYVNPNYKVRLHPEVLLAAAKAYVDGADKRLMKKR